MANSCSNRAATIDEAEEALIKRCLLEVAGVVPGENPEFETSLGFAIETEVDENEFQYQRTTRSRQNDIPRLNPSDIICEKKERHRRALKLGEIPYQTAWMDGFTYMKGEPILYKGRMLKAFKAGRKARGIDSE
jgi:hypothetical protein